MAEGVRGDWPCRISIEEAESDGAAVSFTVVLFIQIRTLAHRLALQIFRGCPSCSFNSFWKRSYKHAQTCVSMVILNPLS